jgi:hypothetical protein
MTAYDNAIHSDFLIHWTGKDIDCELQPNWYHEDHRSKTLSAVDDLYLKRLSDILTYGLWMTEDGERKSKVGSVEITIPSTPHCCFTELKLSESRRHAWRYGRLGIGVKRPFLFQRFGRPLAYFGYGDMKHNDKFLEACWHDLKDKRLMNFFKPMNTDSQTLTYEVYAESEWRILYFQELVKTGKIIDPRDSANSAHHAYFNTLPPRHQQKLRFLVPLDGWFAMVIYPSLPIKNRAQWDNDYKIREQIIRIKSSPDHANRVEGGNWPIEVNLDAIRNF